MSRKNDKISPLGKRILEAIEEQGLTKTSLCQKMDISRSTLYSWISGATAPDSNEVQLLYRILNINQQERSFRDEIFEGDYIGLHRRVWEEFEKSRKSDRDLLQQAMAILASARNG